MNQDDSFTALGFSGENYLLCLFVPNMDDTMTVIVILSKMLGKIGQNDQITPLAEILCDVSLFWNDVGIYHTFKTRILHRTWVENWVFNKWHNGTNWPRT